jgi:O-antigen/teichoic acid export membrane protein/polysaccharide pyruvyl transferase WcaK-like protein
LSSVSPDQPSSPPPPRKPTTAAQGTFWAYAQNWAARGITLVVFFALARLLTPAEFGAFAVTMVFLTLGEIFVEQLFAHAIVQREALRPEHLNAAFFGALAFGLGLSALTLLGAPVFAWAFAAPGIEPLIMSLSPVFVFMALSSVPAALLRRALDYRTLAHRTAISNLSSGVVAIAAAVAGLGVWAFVLQQLCFHAIGTWILWRHEAWRPSRDVSFPALRALSGFSVRMSLIKLLDLVETRLIELIVGHQMGLVALGNYALAARAQQAATQLLAAPLWESSISVFSRQQSVRAELVASLQQRSLMAAMLIAPVFLFAAASADVLIPAVFGAKWLDTVLTFQILCVLGSIRAVAFLHGALLQAIGEAGASLKVSIVRSAVALCALPLLMRHGTWGVAACLVVGQLASMPFIFQVIRAKLGLGVLQLMGVVAKPMVPALLAAWAGWSAAQFATAHGLPPAVGTVLSLGASGGVFLLLLGFVMPRRLALMARRLPGLAGRAAHAWFDGIAKRQDSLRVRVFMVLLASGVSRRHRSSRQGGVVVVFGDASSLTGSVEDQALFGGLSTVLSRAGIRRARALCRPGVPMPACDDGLVLEALPMWGSLRQARALGRELADASALVIVGADSLDGSHSRFESLLRLRLAAFCARRQVPALLCSFSFNGDPDPSTVEAFRKFPQGVTLLCRDDLSRERVARLAGEGVQLTADLGFLMQPSRHSALDDQVASWLAAQRRPGQPRVAWSLSPHALVLTPDQRAQAVVSCAKVIEALVTERDALVVLMPHDFQAHADDPAILADVLARIPLPSRERVLLPVGPYTAADAAQCFSHFDFVFAGHMHLMIAALGRDVPPLGIAYPGKSEGVCRHFGLGVQCLVAPVDLCDPALLRDKVFSQLDARQATRTQIVSRRPAVQDMASAAITLFWKELA